MKCAGSAFANETLANQNETQLQSIGCQAIRRRALRTTRLLRRAHSEANRDRWYGRCIHPVKFDCPKVSKRSSDVEKRYLVTLSFDSKMPVFSRQGDLMSRFIIRLATLLSASLILAARCGANDGIEPPAPIGNNPLVQQALQAELIGDSELRTAKLREVLTNNGEDETARWHAGFVNFENRWIPARIAHQAVAESKPIAEYRLLRDQYSSSFDGQIWLARWCRSRKLADRERLHWFNVLKIDPSNKEARLRLTVQEFGGRLVTADELQQWKNLMRQHRESLDEWTPKMTRWLLTIEMAESASDNDGWNSMIKITDPTAVAAMEMLFDEQKHAAKKSIVLALGNIQEQNATDALIRIALKVKDPSLVDLVTNQLTQRSWFGYVPTMLSYLETPVKYQYSIRTWRNTVYGQWLATKENFHASVAYSKSFHSQVPVITRKNDDLRLNRSGYYPDTDNKKQLKAINKESSLQVQKISRMIAKVERGNRQRSNLNQRIYHVLETATGERLGSNPKDWWEWWADHNEYFIKEEKPEYYVHRSHHRETPVRISFISCFVAGTPVWTDCGPLPIEQLRVGDRVLSQDSDSGELGYKLVLDTTIRPASPTLRIRVGNESIDSTLGHPFWVVGQGWKMAKLLKVGDRLHSVNGGRVIDAIEPGEELPAYNLVVHETNNYFVSKQQILVHDNTPRDGSKQPLPGWMHTSDEKQEPMKTD